MLSNSQKHFLYLEDSNFSDHFEDIDFEDFLDVSFDSSNPSGKQSLERSSPDGEAGNDNKDNHDDSDSTIKELDETLEMKSIEKPEISDEDTNNGLQCRVKELEETLEMIQEEFELMEDYWQEKLKVCLNTYLNHLNMYYFYVLFIIKVFMYIYVIYIYQYLYTLEGTRVLYSTVRRNRRTTRTVRS